MKEVFSKALNKSIAIDRSIGILKGAQQGPSVIFLAGMHGNEPSGVFALKQVFELLEQSNVALKGNLYALAGNLTALKSGARYHRQDLNRLWTTSRVLRLKSGELDIEDEDVVQQQELYSCIKEILEDDQGPFYFMDLHSTSCETLPFIVLNDSLLNRKFTLQYPLPMILGIEEYLEGPLLSYINELGYVAFGFEAGQHDALSAIENHEAFIMLSLVFCGCIDADDIDFTRYFEQLAKPTPEIRHFFEIFFLHKIEEGETFQMMPGFRNFQKIKSGQKLAVSNRKNIFAARNARLFMPLYQTQGSEGYFLIRKVPLFFLNLSKLIRKLRLDWMLPLLPGISWVSKSREILKVNRHIAIIFTKQIFHLMGYRSKLVEKNYYLMKNREAASKEAEYKNENWYKSR
jgi:hypothetical protein